MNFKKVLSVALKLVLWLALFSVTVLNSRKSLQKYLNDKTAIGTTLERVSALKFPSLTVCDHVDAYSSLHYAVEKELVDKNVIEGE